MGLSGIPGIEKDYLTRPAAMTFAGFDPTGGAGVLADCRTFESLGFRGIAVITAMTVQCSTAVDHVEGIPDRVLRRSAEVLTDHMAPSTVKIGMLHNALTVETVAEACRRLSEIPMVLDPVFAASDGTRLLDDAGLEAMMKLLVPRVDVITPNVQETLKLTGVNVRDETDVAAAAERLFDLGARNVVIKGGHLSGDPIDFLVTRKGRWSFRSKRVDGPAVHGTGCVFSAALSALLGRGLDLKMAVGEAKGFVTDYIEVANAKR